MNQYGICLAYQSHKRWWVNIWSLCVNILIANKIHLVRRNLFRWSCQYNVTLTSGLAWITFWLCIDISWYPTDQNQLYLLILCVALHDYSCEETKRIVPIFRSFLYNLHKYWRIHLTKVNQNAFQVMVAVLSDLTILCNKVDVLIVQNLCIPVYQTKRLVPNKFALIFSHLFCSIFYYF